jgi:hypothetical protein
LIITTTGNTFFETERKEPWRLCKFSRASLFASCANTLETGNGFVEQENERRAREKPTIAPKNTRLNTNIFFDAKMFPTFIYFFLLSNSP